MFTPNFKMSNNNYQTIPDIKVKNICELGKIIIDKLIEKCTFEEAVISNLDHSLKNSINAWKQSNLSCQDVTTALSGCNSKLSETYTKMYNSMGKGVRLYHDVEGMVGYDIGFKKVFWVQTADESSVNTYKSRLFGSYKKISLILGKEIIDVAFCYEPYERAAKLLLVGSYIDLNSRECGRLLGYNNWAIAEWIASDRYCSEAKKMFKEDGEHYLKFLLEPQLYRSLSMDRFKESSWEDFTECENCKEVGKDLIDPIYADEAINYSMILKRLEFVFSYFFNPEELNYKIEDSYIQKLLQEVVQEIANEFPVENRDELKKQLRFLGFPESVQTQVDVVPLARKTNPGSP